MHKAAYLCDFLRQVERAAVSIVTGCQVIQEPCAQNQIVIHYTACLALAPRCSASWALTRRPVKMSSLARGRPTTRGSRCVPPALQVLALGRINTSQRTLG